MGLDVVFECEDDIQAGPRPKITQSSERSRAKVDERDIKGLLRSKYFNLKRLDGDSEELRLHASSPRRKSMPARSNVVHSKHDEVVKRGSVYQSSREVRRMKQIREGAESELSEEAFLSFEITEPLPQSSSRKNSGASKKKMLDKESTSGSITEKSSDIFELSFRDLPETCTKEIREDVCLQTSEQKSDRSKKSCTKGYANNALPRRDAMYNLPKSFSAKAVMFNSPCQSEREAAKSSPKSRFGPFKRMLDPIMKSKSQRNPSLTDSSVNDNKVLRKSLLNDFAKVKETDENDSGPLVKEQVVTAVSSPAHLHAVLKFESKHGAPSYEFTVDDPEDTLYAKTWKSDSAFNWVYTFNRSKKSKERHGQSSPIIGQMQVSCYLCSEMNDTGSLDNSTVTEFILYDIAQARRSFAVEEGSQPSTFTIADSLTVESPPSDLDSDASTSYPWAPTDLHPHLENAAIVIQIPFDKKEPTVACTSPAHVKVVTPSGTHGLPCSEDGNPSSLLDRWRFGGRCDCGGWDMSCPIVVFDNQSAKDAADDSVTQCQQPISLFVQGKKEKIPALSITADGKGQYSISFHAQLSSLQAFSICIAILSSEAASALGQDNQHMLYSTSLKLLLEEEVRHLIEAVEKEKRKAKKRVDRRVEQIPTSFVLDPPFSPMGR